MFGDSWEFEQEEVDTSYGYSSNSTKEHSRRSDRYSNEVSFVYSDDDDDFNIKTMQQPKSSYHSTFASTTFLNSEPRSGEVITDSQKVLLAAGCSEHAAQVVRDLSVAELYQENQELSVSDRELLSQQLDVDSLVDWNPDSIYTELGIDQEGKFKELSLIRLHTFLCSVHRQLSVMEQQIERHRLSIKQSRKAGTSKELGLEDCGNRRQLSFLLFSLNEVGKSLTDRFQRLNMMIEGREEHSGSVPMWVSAAVVSTGLLMSVIYAAKYWIEK